MPASVTLSAAAITVLRFEIKGWRSKAGCSRLPAYRELAAAGIMEVAPGSTSEFRFTDDGFKRREEILREAEIGIERERFEAPDASNLSRRRPKVRQGSRSRIRRGSRADHVNRPFFRELVDARIMVPVHAFVGGREAAYRFTYWGWERRFELAENRFVLPWICMI